MSKQEYDDAMMFIQKHIEEITEYAQSVRDSMEFIDALVHFEYFDSDTEVCDYTDFDYWDAYGDRVDINFYGDNNVLRCVAYPVVNGIPNYDQVCRTLITLEEV
jgi:hypothetical protein